MKNEIIIRDYTPTYGDWPMTLTIILGGIAMLGIMTWLGPIGMSRSELVECNTWAAQATQYHNFYLTRWQADQCAAHNITINAPIK